MAAAGGGGRVSVARETASAVAKGRPAARGRGKAQGDGHAPTGTRHTGATQHGSNEPPEGHQHWEEEKGGGHSTMERGGSEDRRQDTHQQGKNAPHRGERHHSTPHTQSTPRDPQRTLPHPSTRQTTPGAHAHKDAPPQPDLTAHEPHRIAPTNHQHPHRGRGVHLHRGPPRAPHSPSPHHNRQATTPATFHCTGHHTDTRARTPEKKEDAAPTPRTRDDTEVGRQDGRGTSKIEETTPPHPVEPGAPLGTGTPRGHGTKAQASREGNPTDTRLTHRPGQQTQTPRSTNPASRTT